MGEVRWAFAILGWALAGAMALASCDKGGSGFGDGFEQVGTLHAGQLTASQINAGQLTVGSVTIANGAIRIADAQGRTTLIDATGVHALGGGQPAASAAPPR